MAPGTSAVLRSQDERLSWYDEEPEQAWCPRFLAPAHHGPLSVGATVGALTVEVPQIQFFDDAGGFWAGLVFGSTVDTWSASAPGCFWKVFFVKENSNLEVDSRPADSRVSFLAGRAKEEDTIVAMASDAAGRTWFQVSGPRGHCWWWLSGSRHTQWDHSDGTPPGGRLFDRAARLPAVQSYVFFTAISSLDRVLDIPVVPQKGESTVQSFNKVVDAVVYDSCLWSRQCSCVHRQGRRHTGDELNWSQRLLHA